MRKPPARTIWLSEYGKELVRLNPAAAGRVDWNVAESMFRLDMPAKLAAQQVVATNPEAKGAKVVTPGPGWTQPDGKARGYNAAVVPYSAPSLAAYPNCGFPKD